MKDRRLAAAALLGLALSSTGAPSRAQEGGARTPQESEDAGDPRGEAALDISELERLLPPAELALASRGPVPGKEARYRECLAGFTMPELVRSAASGELEGEKILEIVSSDVFRYSECRAYAGRNLEACSDLKWFQFGSDDRAELCVGFAKKLAFAKSIIGNDPDAAKVCERLYLKHDETDDAVRGRCRISTSGLDPKTVCARVSLLQPRPYDEREMTECVFFQGARTGSRQYCGLIPDKTGYCLQFSAYKDIARTGDPRLCGDGEDSFICRLLMGETAGTCDGFLQNIETAYCRDRSSGADGGGRERLLRRAAKAASLLARWKLLLDAPRPRGLLSDWKHRMDAARYDRETRRLARVSERIGKLAGLSSVPPQPKQ